MNKPTKSDKILLLGVDGMDPRLTRKYVDMGLMPNTKKYLQRGSARHDLTMLGGHPTITPPMWTTLATGANSNVHGITGYYRCPGTEIDSLQYNIDSRRCKAEPVWNCFAEAGKKTLVWHWPGSSWPPTSDNPNLMVVDGTSPGSVGMAVAQVDTEFLAAASTGVKNVTFKPKAATDAKAACIIEDLELDDDAEYMDLEGDSYHGVFQAFVCRKDQQSSSITEIPLDVSLSPIKDATGWADAPNEAKEFTLLLSGGLIRRPALILKNPESNSYDHIAIFKNKKTNEPIAVCYVSEMVVEVVDEAIKNDVHYEKVNRNYKLLSLDPNGEQLTLYISAGMDMTNDSVWHPKRLFNEVTENIGFPTPTSMVGCQDSLFITDCMLANWYVSADWQAKSLLYLIEHENLDVVFSHFHAIDLQAHMFIKHLANRASNKHPIEVAEKWMQDIYIQTDYYLGKFLHLLDEGWTIFIFSDHGQVASKHDYPLLTDCNAVCTPLMEELGYTATIKNDEGKVIGINWANTTAVMQREGHIYINLKGRQEHGIVDPADQYELEERIITDLYGLRDPETGHRIVSVALRNREAVLLGQGGPEAGDILCWNAEGYNFDHGDCLSTTLGENDTSVSPIFIAAGTGIKENYETERIIREIDLAPTIAVLGDVRMPAQCEGAPVYQILK